MQRRIYVEMGTMFSLLKSCGPPNDIITFFGAWLKKFADPCHRATRRLCDCVYWADDSLK